MLLHVSLTFTQCKAGGEMRRERVLETLPYSVLAQDWCLFNKMLSTLASSMALNFTTCNQPILSFQPLFFIYQSYHIVAFTALSDYSAALKIDPSNESINGDAEKIRRLIQSS